LRRDRLVENAVGAPSSRNVAKIALAASFSAQPRVTGQGFDRYFIQALALFASTLAESRVKRIRDSAERVLHAFIVGYAGISCKQRFPIVQ
jgi:hypothetical protein